jgi:hypothetical protein
LGAERSDIDKPKTDLAARNATRANPQIRLTTLPRRVEDPEALRELVLCDWIFLAADSHSARHWVNAAVHQFLIPATQVGVKIPVSPDGDVGQIHTATRLITPGIGCMWCNGLIKPTELAIEMHPEAEREQARYVPGVPAPNVMPLNTLAVGGAVTHFLLASAGLHENDEDLGSVIHRPRIPRTASPRSPPERPLPMVYAHGQPRTRRQRRTHGRAGGKFSILIGATLARGRSRRRLQCWCRRANCRITARPPSRSHRIPVPTVLGM